MYIGYNTDMNIEYASRLEKIEAVLASFLPPAADDNWMSASFSVLPDAVRSVHLKTLLEPCRSLMLRGGKRWRPLLMVLSCELAGGGERAIGLTPLVEFPHTASLIHDDIEDHAEERRGEPAVHLLYGEDTAINCASWLYFHSFSVIDSFPCSDSLKQDLYRLVSRELRRLHLGQAMDIHWHRNPSLIPSRSEYEAMVSLKTGTLSRLAAEAGMIAGGASIQDASFLGDIAARIGVGFQVIDDVRNLATGNPGKKRGDDIVEGKKSLPVLMHVEKNPGDLPLLSSLFEQARADGINSPAVERVIEMVQSSGALDRAREYGIQCIESSTLSLRGRYHESAACELLAGLFDTMREGL